MPIPVNLVCVLCYLTGGFNAIAEKIYLPSLNRYYIFKATLYFRFLNWKYIENKKKIFIKISFGLKRCKNKFLEFSVRIHFIYINLEYLYLVIFQSKLFTAKIRELSSYKVFITFVYFHTWREEGIVINQCPILLYF